MLWERWRLVVRAPPLAEPIAAASCAVPIVRGQTMRRRDMCLLRHARHGGAAGGDGHHGHPAGAVLDSRVADAGAGRGVCGW